MDQNKILFVASTPLDTSAAYPILNGWTLRLGIDEYSIVNAFPKPARGHTSSYIATKDCDLDIIQVRANKAKRVIALGEVADRVLTSLNIIHFTLPHPAPQNTKLVDKELLASEIERCRQWLK